MEYRLQTPVSRETLAPLRAGDTVKLSGMVYTARDAAHKRLTELIQQGKPLPFELAGSAGVSVRTLNAAFREYRQCTPMQALREARLNGVRAELLSAPSGARVRGVAEAWGYANLGIFAAGYRSRFGESPSDTLRRHGGEHLEAVAQRLAHHAGAVHRLRARKHAHEGGDVAIGGRQ